MSLSKDAVTCNPSLFFLSLSFSFILSGLSFVFILLLLFFVFSLFVILVDVGSGYFCMFALNVLLVANMNEKEVIDN